MVRVSSSELPLRHHLGEKGGPSSVPQSLGLGWERPLLTILAECWPDASSQDHLAEPGVGGGMLSLQ